MRDQTLKDPDPTAMPDDVRVHRENEKPALVERSVELCLEDLLNS